MRVPVLLDAWQQECCGTPFGVRDVVRWQLAADRGWSARALGSLLPPLELELTVQTVYGVAGDEPPGCLLSLGGLQVFLGEDPPPSPGALRTVQLLVEDHHGALPVRLPATAGTVVGLREVHREYDGRGEPVPGTTALTRVQRADRQSRLRPGPQLAGLLVELDVDTGR